MYWGNKDPVYEGNPEPLDPPLQTHPGSHWDKVGIFQYVHIAYSGSHLGCLCGYLPWICWSTFRWIHLMVCFFWWFCLCRYWPVLESKKSEASKVPESLLQTKKMEISIWKKKCKGYTWSLLSHQCLEVLRWNRNVSVSVFHFYRPQSGEIMFLVQGSKFSAHGRNWPWGGWPTVWNLKICGHLIDDNSINMSNINKILFDKCVDMNFWQFFFTFLTFWWP